MTKPPEIGRAHIFNRPFGPLCVIGCPRGKGTCSVNVRPTPGDGPLWDNHGTDEAPTLTPSVNCQSCGWHGYVVDGQLSDAPPGLSHLHVCAGCKHPVIVGVDVKPNAIGQMEISLGISEVPRA